MDTINTYLGKNITKTWTIISGAIAYWSLIELSAIIFGLMMVSVHMGQHLRSYDYCLRKLTSIRIILDKHLSFIKNWDKEIDENIVWPVLSKKLKKYRPFVRFNSTSTKLIMKEVFLNENA